MHLQHSAAQSYLKPNFIDYCYCCKGPCGILPLCTLVCKDAFTICFEILKINQKFVLGFLLTFETPSKSTRKQSNHFKGHLSVQSVPFKIP